MARMSIDDMFLRDPRVMRLANALGWSKFEVRGRLLSVFAIVYDRVDADAGEVLSMEDVDIAAEHEGFAAHMIEFDLAVETRDGVRVRGATERTKYLATREESGRRGGLKSGETRRNKAKVKSKVTFAKNEGPSNPPDPVPDLPPDLVPAPDPISQISRALPAHAHAIPPAQPSPATRPAAAKLAHEVWKRVSEARVAIAAELHLDALPLPLITPAERRGFRDLRDRLAEEGENAVAACERVVEGLIAQARDEQSVEWLSEKAFTDGGWRTAREFVPGAAKRTIRAGPRAAGGAIGAATPRSDHPESTELKPFGDMLT